eukprot:454218_1
MDPLTPKILIFSSFFYTKLTSMNQKEQTKILETALMTIGGMNEETVNEFMSSLNGEKRVYDLEEEIESDDFIWENKKRQRLNLETLSVALSENDALKNKKDMIIGNVANKWESLRHTINYADVERWTKDTKFQKLGFVDCHHIFQFNKILIPIHENGNHWTNISIDTDDKTIIYRNSMMNSGSGWTVMLNIGKYLHLEFEHKVKNKFNYKYNSTEWRMLIDSDYPQQKGTLDCAVFASKCIEWEAEGIPIDYGQHKVDFQEKNDS